jgi:hypothetical protein
MDFDTKAFNIIIVISQMKVLVIIIIILTHLCLFE